MPVYLLMIEFADGEKRLMTGIENKLVVAKKDNTYLLSEMGQDLLDNDSIIGYQLLCTSEPPVRKYHCAV